MPGKISSLRPLTLPSEVANAKFSFASLSFLSNSARSNQRLHYYPKKNTLNRVYFLE